MSRIRVLVVAVATVAAVGATAIALSPSSGAQQEAVSISAAAAAAVETDCPSAAGGSARQLFSISKYRWVEISDSVTARPAPDLTEALRDGLAERLASGAADASDDRSTTNPDSHTDSSLGDVMMANEYFFIDGPVNLATGSSALTLDSETSGYGVADQPRASYDAPIRLAVFGDLLPGIDAALDLGAEVWLAAPIYYSDDVVADMAVAFTGDSFTFLGTCEEQFYGEPLRKFISDSGLDGTEAEVLKRLVTELEAAKLAEGADLEGEYLHEAADQYGPAVAAFRIWQWKAWGLDVERPEWSDRDPSARSLLDSDLPESVSADIMSVRLEIQTSKDLGTGVSVCARQDAAEIGCIELVSSTGDAVGAFIPVLQQSDVTIELVTVRETESGLSIDPLRSVSSPLIVVPGSEVRLGLSTVSVFASADEGLSDLSLITYEVPEEVPDFYLERLEELVARQASE